MGIYYDSMTRKGKINTKKQTKEKWDLKKKKCKRKVLGGVKDYIDGLSEYVSDGCEDNVVLNIVITF